MLACTASQQETRHQTLGHIFAKYFFVVCMSVIITRLIYIPVFTRQVNVLLILLADFGNYVGSTLSRKFAIAPQFKIFARYTALGNRRTG